MKSEDGLAVFGKHHEVGLPMAGAMAIVNGLRALGNRYAAVDKACRTSAPFATKAAFGFGARQVSAPGEVIGAADLGIDEAVDGFVADHRSAVLASQPASDLFGRQAKGKAGKNSLAQSRLSFEPGASPSPGFALFLGKARFVGRSGAIALQFARNGRWRAIHSCSDFADRTAFALKPGNRTAVFQ